MPFSSLMAPHGISLRDRFCSCMGKRPPRTTSPATRKASPEVAEAVEPAEDADEEVGGGKRRKKQETTAAVGEGMAAAAVAAMMAVPTWGWNLGVVRAFFGVSLYVDLDHPS